MIIAYSSLPGYASLRDHENGTWFIQSLVEGENILHLFTLFGLSRSLNQRVKFTPDLCFYFLRLKKYLLCEESLIKVKICTLMYNKKK